MKVGMLFPGQGSQFIGMGKKFYDQERLMQEHFDEAAACLDRNFVRLCFASTEKEIMNTANAQTAIFVVSAGIYRILKEKYKITPTIVAGNSLGEYSAIFAAQGMSMPDTLYLLNKRALFMEDATKKQSGGMIAVIGLAHERVKAICQQYDWSGSNDRVAEVVNFNSPTQVVVSGTMRELEMIKSDVETFGGKAIVLRVAGAFHSRLMREAEQEFSKYLVKVDFSNLKAPLVSNVNAELISSSEQVKEALVKQTSSPILWWQSMQYFEKCDVIIEVGPGTTFSRILKREWPDKHILSINSPSDVEPLLAILKDLKV